MTDLTNIGIILPSLDPDEKLRGVIEGLLDVGFRDILLINDGSKPENLHYFTEAAEAHPEITLLHHEINRGKGAALKTGFRYLLDNRPALVGVVTVDGDGQHHKQDILACAEALAESNQMVLGVRDFDCAVVAIGDDLAASVLATMNLKELGIQQIVCKAHDDTYKSILETCLDCLVECEPYLWTVIGCWRVCSELLCDICTGV